MKKDSLRALKITKASNKDRVQTQFLMHQLLKDALDGLNMSNPLKDKYILDFVEYIIDNYQYEALNDWAKYCYELSFGSLFSGSIYRIGKVELMTTWQNFIDQKYERIEEHYQKKKDQQNRFEVDQQTKKASPDYVDNLLKNWRQERIQASIKAEPVIVEDPVLNEKDYRRMIFKRMLEMDNPGRAEIMISWSRHQHSREYFTTLAKMFDEETRKRIWAIVKPKALKIGVSEIDLEIVAVNFNVPL